MPPTEPPRQAHQHFPLAQHEVFQATLETVRAMPGWEVLTAHPETGEIRARAHGRLFTPTMDHTFRLSTSEEGTDLDIESVSTRRNAAKADEKTVNMFRTLLEDRLARGYFGPL